ncbi:hypothetical protein E2320_003237, partial [Naja naja]
DETNGVTYCKLIGHVSYRHQRGGRDVTQRRKWKTWFLGSLSFGEAFRGRMEPSGVLSAEALRERLLQGLEAEHVHCYNDTGKLVNELLSEELKLIHAFEQRTLTPEQWAKEQEA